LKGFELTAIKLELPRQWQIHNVLNVSLIQLYRYISTTFPPFIASAIEPNELGGDVEGYQFEMGNKV
jgi:hypothetical protein